MEKRFLAAGLVFLLASCYAGAALAENLGSIGVLNRSKLKHQEWEKDFTKKFELRENHVFDKFNNIGRGQIDPTAFTRVLEEHIKKAYRKLPIVIDNQRDYRYAAAEERIENLFIIELDSQLSANISTDDLNTVIAAGTIDGKITVLNITSNKVVATIELDAVSEKLEDEFHMTRGFARSIDKLKDKLLERLASEIRDLEPDLYRTTRYDPVKIADEFIGKKQYLKAYEILTAAVKNNDDKKQEAAARLETLKGQFAGMRQRTVGIAFVGNMQITPQMIGLPEITSLADQEIEGYKRNFRDQFADIVRKGFEETYWLTGGGAFLAVLKKQVEDFYGVTPKIISGGEDVIFEAQSQYVDDLILVEIDGLVHAKYGVGVAETQLSGSLKGINTQTENVVFTLPIDFAGTYSERDGDYKKWAGRGEVSPPGICHFARERLLAQFAEAVKGLDYNFGSEQRMDILFKAREYDKKENKGRALTLLSRWWEDNGKNVQSDMERLQIEVVGELIGQNKFAKANETLNDFTTRFPNSGYADRVEEYQNFLGMANSVAEIEQTPEGFQRAIDAWNIFIRKFPRSKLTEVARREIREYERKLGGLQAR